MKDVVKGKASDVDPPNWSPTGAAMSTVSVAGSTITAPSADICGRTIVVTGRWLRIAAVRDEEWQEGRARLSPGAIVEALRSRHQGLEADIFTFSQPLDDRIPHHPYRCEWDSWAAIPLTTYDDWWTGRVSTDLRKNVRRAHKVGVVVQESEFNDVLVRGIKRIYDETPVRQGKPFWHYKKELDVVKSENSTYLDRSTFLVAFFGDEIVGFIKIVWADVHAHLMQILALDEHRDKRPVNALIAKAVEVATSRGALFLTYGNYHYAQGADSLNEFKRRNGFEEILVPRYFAPLTTQGRLALQMRFHRGIRGLAPPPVLRLLKRIRANFYHGTA